jgi:hypothetical protein
MDFRFRLVQLNLKASSIAVGKVRKSTVHFAYSEMKIFATAQ